MKTCTGCRLAKPLGAFSKDGQKRDGLASRCKECKASYDAPRYAEARSEVQARTAAWAKANRSASNASKAAWRAEHPQYYAAQTRKRYAVVKRATPPWLTAEQLLEIQRIYFSAKEATVLTGVKHSVDHIVPLQGAEVSGLHVPWNLRVVLLSKNVAKKNKMEPQ